MPKNKTLKIVLVLIVISSLNTSTKAQGNLQYIDNRPFHFGFSLGLNTLDFGITPSLDSIGGQVYNADVSTLQPGFSVGIISDVRINRFLNLRFTPTLNFGSRQLNYISGGGKRDSTTVLSIPICLPIYIKYSAERKDNYRPYLIWGAGVGFDLSTDQTNPILLKPLNFYTEFGVGCDLYFSFFKLAPELKFGIGFNNLLTPLDQRFAGDLKEDDKKFTIALSKLTSRMLTLTFNFE